jgi:hypothetical protein
VFAFLSGKADKGHYARFAHIIRAVAQGEDRSLDMTLCMRLTVGNLYNDGIGAVPSSARGWVALFARFGFVKHGVADGKVGAVNHTGAPQ